MTSLDWLILAGLGLSAVVGALRGAAYELVTLAGWFVAFAVAHRFAPAVGQAWLHGIPGAPLRDGVAWALCVALTLMAAGLLATLLRLLLRSTGLGLFDRSAGALFGLLRGVVVLALALLAARYTELPQTPAWHASMLIPPAQFLANQLVPLLPEAVHQAAHAI